MCGTYRAYRVCGMGPPSSGATTVLQILEAARALRPDGAGQGSPGRLAPVRRIARLAYADRDLYLGDPDFVSVPVAGLLDPAYLAARSALISPDRDAWPSVAAGTPAGRAARARARRCSEVPGTTALRRGRRRAAMSSQLTSTIEGAFGSGLIVDGIDPQQRADRFQHRRPTRTARSVANRVEGGKRPRSSMAPTIVYDPDGKVRARGRRGGRLDDHRAGRQGADRRARLEADARRTRSRCGLLYRARRRSLPLEQGTAARGDGRRRCRRSARRSSVAPLGLKANAVERVGGALGRRRRSAQRRRGDAPGRRMTESARSARRDRPTGATGTPAEAAHEEESDAQARTFPQSGRDVLRARRARRATRRSCGARRGGAWQPTSWARGGAAGREPGRRRCRRSGSSRGDRVMLVCENRPEWCIADLAIMAAGCVTVPTYTTNTERDHHAHPREFGRRAR